LALLLSLFWCGAGIASDASVSRTDQGYVEGELLVKLKPGISRAEAAALRGAVAAAEVRMHQGIGVRYWRLGAGLTVEQALEVLSKPGHARFVEYAEPNYLVYASELPDDTRFGDLYALNNVGQTGGTADADIDAPEAWTEAEAFEASGPPVLIGVIDSGIDYTHPDLSSRIWVNQAELDGIAGTDDDDNGYVDDVRGWNFVNDTADPKDDNNHGTHVAGTIAAVRNNEEGVAGVASNVRLIPLKFLSASGSGTTENAIRAIQYADGAEARITSNSWGGGSRSRALQDAIATTEALFVAAAGNGGSSSKAYPAGYDDPKIVSVAATDHNDALAPYSNYGSSWVDLAAPGSNIVSTIRDGGYGSNSGTSMATPHVSGAAALILLQDPTRTNAEIKAQLLASVDLLPSLSGKVLTGGRLNLARAVDAEPDGSSTSDSVAPGKVTDLLATMVAGSSSSVSLAWTASGDDGSDGTATAYDIRYAASTSVLAEDNWGTAKQITGEPVPAPSGTSQSYVFTNLEPDTTYAFGVRAIDDVGNVSEIATVSLRTPQGPWAFERNIVTAAGAYIYSRELDFDDYDVPGIAYENESQARYLYRDNGEWHTELIDNSGGRGISFRFAPGGTGNGVLPRGTPTAAYSTFGSRSGLEFASRNASDSWSIATIETRDVSSDTTPLAYDSQGQPAIAYRGKGGLKLAQRGSNGAWSTQIVSPTGGARFVDLAFVGSTDGDTLWIVYSDDLNGDNTLESLMVLKRNPAGSWEGPIQVETGTSGFGVQLDLAINPVSGYPAIVHGPSNGTRYVEFDDRANWSTTVIGAGTYATVAFDADGEPRVAYTKSNQSWLAFRKDGVWTHELIDATGGGRNVIRMDSHDEIHVVYDTQPDGLDLAKRANP